MEEKVKKVGKKVSSLETDVSSLSSKIFLDNTRIVGIIVFYLWTKFLLF